MHVAKTQFEESLLALLFECVNEASTYFKTILKQETNYQTMIKINFFLLLRIIKASIKSVSFNISLSVVQSTDFCI